MMQVLKFGGSSVADATCMSRVIDIVSAAAAEGPVVLVSSAVSGCTDALLALDGLSPTAREEALAALQERHRAIIRRLFTGEERLEAEAECAVLFDELAAAPAGERVTFGELFSTRILARKLACEGFETRWLDSRALVVAGDEPETFRRIRRETDAHPAQIYVAPGFIASGKDGRLTTLGRGGSDYSAALYAAALQAGRLEIWTDVPGIMTANPKTVPAARTLPGLSYKAALDLASHGAKVLYAPTVAPVMRAGIPMGIRDTFDPEAPGTLVSGKPDGTAPAWIGVSSTPGPEADTSDVWLVGSSSLAAEDLPRVQETLRAQGISPLALSLDGNAVDIRVCKAVEADTLRALHAEYFETAPLSTLTLYIAGFGAVGQALTEMIGRTAGTVAERTGKTLRIAGIANSHRCLLDRTGIAPGQAARRLEEEGTPAADFPAQVLAQAPRHAIFIDCTDSETLWRQYEPLLRKGIDIVTSNRRSLAIPFVDYAALRTAARQSGTFLRYETTVGAALPVLESIARAALGCDEITSIEAVVSCSLNRILSGFDTGRHDSFAAALRQAQRDGVTEADPRADLSGRDALRKLLILAREAGIALEAEDVAVEALIAPALMDLPLEEFYRRLEADEAASLQADLGGGDRKRFVASLEKDPAQRLGFRARIRVQSVPEDHPAYRLQGTDNLLLVRSAFHPTPLVIRGAGEGAWQAASSLLNDIVR